MPNNPSNINPMHVSPLCFLLPQLYMGYSMDPQPLLDPHMVPLNSYNNPNSSSMQVAPQGVWFATPQSHSDASGSSMFPSIDYFPEDYPASSGTPSLGSSCQDINAADPSAGFSFIAPPKCRSAQETATVWI